MNSKLYRCGWCGSPTNKDGIILSEEMFQKAIRIIDNYSDVRTELTQGMCCVAEQQNREANRMQVTRDMAIDAQDLSLEGTWI